MPEHADGLYTTDHGWPGGRGGGRVERSTASSATVPCARSCVRATTSGRSTRTRTTIEGLPVYQTIADIPGPVDIVSLYVPAAIGIGLLEAIAAKQPREVWINPGAESAALEARARALGLSPIYACSIVALG